MALSVTYLDDGGALLKGTLTLTEQDVSEANRVLYETPEKIRALVYQLCDYTEVERIDLTYEAVRRLAWEDARVIDVNPKILLAVVGSKDITFGLLRMWQAHADAHSLRAAVFRTLNDARDWIRTELAADRSQTSEDAPMP